MAPDPPNAVGLKSRLAALHTETERLARDVCPAVAASTEMYVHEQPPPPPADSFERPVRCTVCIATFNSMAWLTLVLKALSRQGERLDVILCDNGSQDGTTEHIANPKTKAVIEGLNNHAIREYRVLDPSPHQANVEANVAWSKAKMVDEVKSEYVFWLDHDVSLPSGTLRTLIEEFEQDEKLGALGLPYENSYDHPEMGALLMRTEVAREVGFTHQGNCVCRNLAKALEARGLKMVYWKQAWRYGDHLKYLCL